MSFNLPLVSLLASLTAQKLMLGLIFLGSLAASPFVINEFLSGNYTPFLAVLFFIGTTFFFAFIGRNCWVFMPAFLGLSGRLNVLPANLSMLETATLLALLYLVFIAIYEKRLPSSLGPPLLWIPPALLLSILAYHWIKSGDIGLRLFGGETFGGRKYWTLFVGFLSMPLLYSMVKPRDPLLFWVPLIYFGAVLLDFIPFLLTSLSPSIAPFVYTIYSSVNLDAFQDSIASSFGGDGLVRIGNIGFLAIAIQVCLLSYFPANEWLKPKNWWCFLGSILTLVGCAFSGFRSYLFRLAVVWFVACFSASRWVILIFIPLVAFSIFLLVAGQGVYFKLPLSMQRALSPFPGKWDSVAVKSAEGSSTWRETMKRVYWREYGDKAGWFGEGMTYKKGLTQEGIEEFYGRLQRLSFENEEADARRFIERRQPHEGVLDIHYPAGWVGLALLVFYFSVCSVYVIKNIFLTPAKEMTPDGIWVCAMVLTETLSYFTVYGDFATTLPRLFVLMPLAVRSFAPKTSSLPRNVPQVVTPPIPQPAYLS